MLNTNLKIFIIRQRFDFIADIKTFFQYLIFILTKYVFKWCIVIMSYWRLYTSHIKLKMPCYIIKLLSYPISMLKYLITNFLSLFYLRKYVSKESNDIEAIIWRKRVIIWGNWRKRRNIVWIDFAKLFHAEYVAPGQYISSIHCINSLLWHSYAFQHS